MNQLLLRAETTSGLICEQYDGLPLADPVLIELRQGNPGTPFADLDEIHQALEAEFLAMGAQKSLPPCHSVIPPEACLAIANQHCLKLLALVGDGLEPIVESITLMNWLADDGIVLPILPRMVAPHTVLPSSISTLNLAQWEHSPDETVPAILAMGGVSPIQPRIFISYRQQETSGLAMQLFDALSHKGFDVFLDKFRIPPGANFQSLLTQELGDKAMLLLLESASTLQSPWVTYEINVAKTCGLGVCALNIDSAPETDVIDDEYRMRVSVADFVGGPLDKGSELDVAPLDHIVSRVQQEHDRAHVRRRLQLESSLEGAVVLAGGSNPRRLAGGFYEVVSNGYPTTTYLVALSPRPPDLPDFHEAHSNAHHADDRVIIGLARLMEAQRARRLQWLSGLCNMRLVDEGELAHAADQMVKGSL